MLTKEKFFECIKKNRTKKIELLAGIQTILWGLWLVLPQETFITSGAYKYLLGIAPEWLWGYSMLFLGIIEFFGIFFLPVTIKKVIIIQCVFAWIAITFSFGFSSISSTAVPQAMTGAIAQILALDYNMRGDNEL